MTTLLEVINDVLDATKSFTVSDWNDTAESQIVAGIVKRQMDLLVNDRDLKGRYKLRTLDSLSDLDKPTSFWYPDKVDQVYWVKYKSNEQYKKLTYLDPIEFINKTDLMDSGSTTVKVIDINGVKVNVINNRQPLYWTSFDNHELIFDAYNSEEEDTLQESKTQAYVKELVNFVFSNTFEIPLDSDLIPVLLEQCVSSAYVEIKGTANPKAEAQARKTWILNQGANRKDNARPTWNAYGRL